MQTALCLCVFLITDPLCFSLHGSCYISPSALLHYLVVCVLQDRLLASWLACGQLARLWPDGTMTASLMLRAGAAGQWEGRSWVLRQLIGWLSVMVSPGSEWMWESMWLFVEGGVREREGWTANSAVFIKTLARNLDHTSQNIMLRVSWLSAIVLASLPIS